MRIIASLAVLSVFAIPTVAMASTINLYGTGAGSIGSADPNYTLISSPVTAAPQAATISSTDPYWYAPITGAWVNPSGTGTDQFPNTTPYVYQTTFTLAPGAVLSTATIELLIAADDATDIIFNGNQIASNFGTYATASDFTITSGFVTGLNTLQFVDYNSGGGPTGLYVDVLAASVGATPEPSSLALLGTGMLSVAGLIRRRLKA